MHPSLHLAPWLMGLYVAALIVASVLRTREVRSPFVQLFRAFFPNWKFFEDLGTLPVLSWRCGESEEVFGPWRAPERLRPDALRFAFNPRGNLRLALGSLLQHLEADLHATDEARPETIEQATSYRLVRNWVEAEIRSHAPAAGSADPRVLRYQFRVLGAQPDSVSALYATPGEGDLMLLSPVYTLLEGEALS